MILNTLKKLLSFLSPGSGDDQSGLALVKETLQRRAIYQLKLQTQHTLTNRLNFRAIEIQHNAVILETLYQPLAPADLQDAATLSFTIFLLPEADKLPLVVTCNVALLEILSTTRLRIAIPEHVNSMGLNKNDRMQLDARHIPTISLWRLDKKCSNIRLLKMVNPMLFFSPKSTDADRCLVDISSKGMCLSVSQEACQDQPQRLKPGQDILLQLSFPGPDTSQRHEYIVIATIRYVRQKTRTGRMECGLQFCNHFVATPKPTWISCQNDGIPELDWLLKKYRALYLAEVKSKLSALCDVPFENAATPASPVFVNQERLAAKNTLAQGIYRCLAPPLAHIDLTLQYLALKTDNPQAVPLIAHARQQLEGIGTKMETIHEMSGQDPPQFAPLHLEAVIDQALAAVADLMRQYGITFERTFQEDLPEISGDARQLELVFKNLFHNAIDAMRTTGGRLRATAVLDMPNDALVVSVEDMGCGIPNEYRSRLFEPYQEPGDSGEGLGLGLALCQRVVVGHGGQIDFYSALGEGSTFTIRLPLPPSPLMTAQSNEVTP